MKTLLFFVYIAIVALFAACSNSPVDTQIDTAVPTPTQRVGAPVNSASAATPPPTRLAPTPEPAAPEAEATAVTDQSSGDPEQILEAVALLNPGFTVQELHKEILDYLRNIKDAGKIVTYTGENKGNVARAAGSDTSFRFTIDERKTVSSQHEWDRKLVERLGRCRELPDSLIV